MGIGSPTRTKTYQNHHLDSTRWDGIDLRDGDIVISTPYKCGTTWTQSILLHLIFQDLQHRQIGDFSPWIEFRATDWRDMKATLDGQSHRRCMKSHVPADAIPFDPRVKYVIVGRDPRDVFMSLWNHYNNYSDAAYTEFNQAPDLVGEACPRCPSDIHTFWSDWISRGWFDWEGDGYPFWSNFYHMQSWWPYRELENVHFVHYNDLLASPRSEIQRLARFVEIDCSDKILDQIVEATSFNTMKKAASALVAGNKDIFEGGADTFINKGTNGRWAGVLTEMDLAQYATTAAATLSADCRLWLEGKT